MRIRQLVAIAVCTLCAGVIGWTWLRPLVGAALPPPPKRVRHKRAQSPERALVAAPDDEPAAEEPATVATGIPEMLDRRDLENALAKIRPRIDRCRERDQFNGLLTVTMVIKNNGNVQSATVQPPLDQSETARCVTKMLKGASFPRFRGTYLPTIEWTYPFLFREPEK
jgi:hypothetical protein